MNIALYKGTSGVSRAIRWITRSDYSHAAFVFDPQAERAAAAVSAEGGLTKIRHWRDGAVIEAWKGGVQNSPSLCTLHTPGTVVDLFEPVTPMTFDQDKRLVLWLNSIIGDPYSYWNVLRFISRRPGRDDGAWFCSEACVEGFTTAGWKLFERTQAWEVPPGWIARSLALRWFQTITTA